MAADAGRAPIPVTTYGGPNDGPADVERVIDARVERLIWYLPADGRDAALRRLEAVTELTRPFR